MTSPEAEPRIAQVVEMCALPSQNQVEKGILFKKFLIILFLFLFALVVLTIAIKFGAKSRPVEPFDAARFPLFG
uniref:Formate dehydrogenase subunit gamma n=1 Tax=Caenorhabditis tropicalis TaxID=1561998 RepID=A0A1I7UV67_9PELO